MKIRKIIYTAIVLLLIFFYYQLDYKRHFVYSKDKLKVLTIWQRLGNTCYIMPGKYYWILPPKSNCIETKNYRNYFGIIWNTTDSYDYKIAIYNDYKVIDLDDNIKIYANIDSLKLEYKMLDTLNIEKGIRVVNNNEDSLKNIYDYNYIDLNRIYGVKIYGGNW